LDKRSMKVVVGLAVESAIVHGRDTRTLLHLYSMPDLERLQELHNQLLTSPLHYDREIAIWLEPALELDQPTSDPRNLVREMREMEFVLHVLLNWIGSFQEDVNNWMNFIANAAQSIEDGFWIDGKILLSRALQSSLCPSVERLKADPRFRYELDVLQKATASYFEEVKGYPIKLSFPEHRLDAILKVQEIMLELMQIHFREESRMEPEETRQPIHKLSSAMRYMMDDRKEIEDAKREIRLALGHLETRLNTIADDDGHTMILDYHNRLRGVLNTL